MSSKRRAGQVIEMAGVGVERVGRRAFASLVFETVDSFLFLLCDSKMTIRLMKPVS